MGNGSTRPALVAECGRSQATNVGSGGSVSRHMPSCDGGGTCSWRRNGVLCVDGATAMHARAEPLRRREG